jgi:hypothetical protein
MNWGKGIVLGLLAFVIFITAMGIKMFAQPDDVDHQYYEKGLAFDTDYNREKQVVTDKLQPTIWFDDDIMHVKFVKPLQCKITLMRPSDRHMDKTLNMASNTENEIDIPTMQLSKGPWQLTFEWTDQHKKYLYNQEVMVP